MELNGQPIVFKLLKRNSLNVLRSWAAPFSCEKEAVIVDYFVEKGEPVITINEFVKPGQLLVSGLIGKKIIQNSYPQPVKYVENMV